MRAYFLSFNQIIETAKSMIIEPQIIIDQFLADCSAIYSSVYVRFSIDGSTLRNLTYGVLGLILIFIAPMPVRK